VRDVRGSHGPTVPDMDSGSARDEATVDAGGDEVGLRVDVDGLGTNYHRTGAGPAVLLVHGSGPGVSAWANWRLTIPALAQRFDVVAPDVVGFGFTDRPPGFRYGLDSWREHLLG
jgi:2-hydroxymuconate-semialdehyde hydrolase